MSHKKFARVGDILPAVLKSIGLDRKLKEREVLTIWPAAVGADIAARTQAVRIDRGILYVRVEQSAWMQELHFMERELLNKLRKKAPDIEIRRIRFGMNIQN